MISAVAPNLFNPSEVVVRGTPYKLKATNYSLPTVLISLPLSHTHTQLLLAGVFTEAAAAAGDWLLPCVP